MTLTLNDVAIDTVAGLTNHISAAREAGQTTWSSTTNWDGGFRSSALIRDFQPIPSDEPPALGGTDSAPNPVEQLLAALGNCLVVGYAANATARGIALNTLSVEIEGDLDLAVFLGLEEGHAGFDRIRASVDIDSSATPEELAELHAHVLSTSPVGHTLGSAIPIDIELANRKVDA